MGGFIGIFSGIKNLRSFDTSLPLVATDLPSSERSAVGGKRVKQVFLSFLNIKQKE